MNREDQHHFLELKFFFKNDLRVQHAFDHVNLSLLNEKGAIRNTTRCFR
jgi:hypothetical protein